MKLTLRDIRLPLAHFTLEVDAEITRDGIGATGLFGPSGAGKTTLLDLIAGLRQAPSARIELDGRVLTDTGRRVEVPARAREIGYVPQDGALFPHLSVRGNLLYGRKRGRGEERALSLEHVTEVLAIGHLLDRRIGGLSGGEKQRVALARALLSAPRLLLLDEPLAALDGDLKGSILEYLRQVRDELRVPMLYVSHATEEILALCDEVLVLERGRLTAQGDPRAILVRNGLSNGISSPP